MKTKSIPFLIILPLLTLIICLNFIKYLDKNIELNYKWTYWGLPIAISSIIGHEHNYSGFQSVREYLSNPNIKNQEDFNKALKQVYYKHNPSGTNVIAVVSDDLGTVDLSYLALKIFGPNTKSIDKTIMLIFLISVFLFFLSYYKEKKYLIFIIPLLACFCVNFSNSVDLLKHEINGKELFTSALNDPRFFSMFAVISILHIFVFALNFEKQKNLNILTLLFQIIILAFYCWVRSSIKLDVTLLIFAVILIGFLNIKKITSYMGLIFLIIFVVFMIPKVMKYEISSIYAHETLTAGHPIIMMLRAGILFDNQNLKEKYFWEDSNNIDKSIFDSAGKYYNKINPSKDKEEIIYTTGGANLDKIKDIEIKFIFDILYNEPYEVLKNFIYYKPVKIYQAFINELSHRFGDVKNYQKNHFLNELKIFFIPVFLIITSIFYVKLKINFLFQVFYFYCLPVTIKNFLFWGIFWRYFYDLFILYFAFILFIIMYIINTLIYVKKNNL